MRWSADTVDEILVIDDHSTEPLPTDWPHKVRTRSLDADQPCFRRAVRMMPHNPGRRRLRLPGLRADPTRLPSQSPCRTPQHIGPSLHRNERNLGWVASVNGGDE